MNNSVINLSLLLPPSKEAEEPGAKVEKVPASAAVQVLVDEEVLTNAAQQVTKILGLEVTRLLLSCINIASLFLVS